MALFRAVVYAESDRGAYNCYDKLTHFLRQKKCDKCEQYIDAYWVRRNEWCSAYLKLPQVRGNNTNNYAEANIRVFKDIGVNRMKQYNAVALLQAIVTTMEDFYRDRMLKFANNQHRQNYYRMRNMLEKIKYLKNDAIYKITDKLYAVQSEYEPESFYEVNISDKLFLRGKYLQLLFNK
jgi:hypothetical protein